MHANSMKQKEPKSYITYNGQGNNQVCSRAGKHETRNFK